MNAFKNQTIRMYSWYLGSALIALCSSFYALPSLYIAMQGQPLGVQHVVAVAVFFASAAFSISNYHASMNLLSALEGLSRQPRPGIKIEDNLFLEGA